MEFSLQSVYVEPLSRKAQAFLADVYAYHRGTVSRKLFGIGSDARSYF
jgi:hypothetical protein